MKIKWLQWADVLQTQLFEIDIRLSNHSTIEDQLYIFGILYFTNNFKCTEFLVTHLPLQKHRRCEEVQIHDSESHERYCEMNMGECGWDMQNSLPAKATIVPVICTSDKTHLNNYSGD